MSVDLPDQEHMFQGPKSGLQLSANFAARICGGVDVDIQISRLEARKLRVSKLCARGDGIGVPVLREWHDHRSVLAWRGFVDVCRRPGNSGGLHASADRSVGTNDDRPGAGPGALDRWHF